MRELSLFCAWCSLIRLARTSACWSVVPKGSSDSSLKVWTSQAHCGKAIRDCTRYCSRQNSTFLYIFNLFMHQTLAHRTFRSLSKFSFMLITKRSSNDLLSLKQKAARHNKNNKPRSVKAFRHQLYGSCQPFHSSYSKPWNAVIKKSSFWTFYSRFGMKWHQIVIWHLNVFTLCNKISI